jgi:GAF domain-containing protein
MDEFWPLEEGFGVLRGSSEENAFRELIQTCLACTKADEGSLLVFDKRANELVFALTVGQSSSDNTLRGQRVPIGKGITGLAALTKQPQIGSPVYKDVKQSELRADSPHSVLAAPLLLHNEVLGVMTVVTFDHARSFSMDDAATLQRVCNVAALVIDQRQRLASQSKEQAATGGQLAANHSKETELIASSLATLIGDDPRRAATVAQLLSGISALAVKDRR